MVKRKTGMFFYRLIAGARRIMAPV